MSTPTTGRRIAARQRRRPDRGAVVGIVLVALSGLLLATAGLVEAEPEPAGSPATVAVDNVATACLRSPSAGAARAYTLAAPLAEAPEDAAGEATLTTGPVGEQAAPGSASPRGELETLEVPGRGSALAVTTTGNAAVGRVTFQVETADDSTALAVQECLAPRARWWFTGGGADLDHRSELVLANLDPGPAVVDVIVHGPDGPVDSVSTRGITVAPGEVTTVDLVEIAPQSDELAVHVEASRGRVAAGLADSFATSPAAEPGLEWVPSQAEASRTVRLAPLPRRADRRTLVVTNPGDREALVDVEVSGASGSFAPTDVAQVRVPPGSVVTADLGTAIGRDASAVVLQSPVPVTATVRSTLGADVSYAAAVPVLDGPAAGVLAEGTQAAVLLTAGESGGKATATAYAADGSEVDSAELSVEPTATLAWSPEGRAAYVVVTPRGGRLSGGLDLAGAAGVSQLALRPLPVVLRKPVVVPVVR